MPIEWSDELNTGIPIIDEQHQELLVMLNRLGRLRCGRESLLEALNDLQDYVNTHFKTEEEFMIQIKYPEYSKHKLCHDKFIKDIEIIQEKLDKVSDINDLGIELYESVAGWIIDHYSVEDVELVKYIKKHP